MRFIRLAVTRQRYVSPSLTSLLPASRWRVRSLGTIFGLGLWSLCSAACTSSTSSGNPDPTTDPQVDVCAGTVNTPGRVVDLPWPAASNIGHEVVPGETVRFHWTGSHNVLQVATFEGQMAPLSRLGDASWPRELRSGGKQTDGSFDWNVGKFSCGYRPGIYFFVDEENPAGGVVSVNLTDIEAKNYSPKPCSTLADPGVYGGRYAQYAGRPGCTVYEVNNFQTEAHFDWVQPIFTAQQGDVVVFRWTGTHNVAQVHDVTQDVPLAGGIYSGAKTNCVGGPAYSCVNGAASLGEFLFDTTNHRPGIIHISDECALTCTGHTTGMNMEIDLRFAVPRNTPQPPVRGGCCAIDKTKGASCRVVEIYNGNDGAQFDYNVPVGRNDLVRFRWAGKLKIYQSMPNANGSPSATPKAGGVAMPDFVECVPGANMSCLGGNSERAQLIFDVAAQLRTGNVETNMFGQKYFDFHALGENTSGYTSADTGTLLYVDDSIQYDATPCP